MESRLPLASDKRLARVNTEARGRPSQLGGVRCRSADITLQGSPGASRRGAEAAGDPGSVATLALFCWRK